MWVNAPQVLYVVSVFDSTIIARYLAIYFVLSHYLNPYGFVIKWAIVYEFQWTLN